LLCVYRCLWDPYKTLKYTVYTERRIFFLILNMVVCKITTGRYRDKHTPLRRMAQWIITHAVFTWAVDECECELHDPTAFSPRNGMHAVHWIWGCSALGAGLGAVEKMQLSCSSCDPSHDLSTCPNLLSLLTELSRLPKEVEAKNQRVSFPPPQKVPL